MKNFEIIEEGRLSKSEMNDVTGGNYTGCVNMYTIDCCEQDKNGCTVTCEKDYLNETTGTVCRNMYLGKPIAVTDYDVSGITLPTNSFEGAIVGTVAEQITIGLKS